MNDFLIKMLLDTFKIKPEEVKAKLETTAQTVASFDKRLRKIEMKIDLLLSAMDYDVAEINADGEEKPPVLFMGQHRDTGNA